MENRSEFLKACAIAVVDTGSSIVLSSNSLCSGSFNMPAGIIYIKENSGK